MMNLEAHVLRGPINDIYNMVKNKVRAHKHPDLEKVYQKGLSVCKVKTIWQTDKAVDLNKFYYPSKIVIDDDAIQINSLNDIPARERMVIQGTAGQGKSIFLRYLSGKELVGGERIPVFIELMKISDKYCLGDLIANSLNELGFNCGKEEIEMFLSTNKFSLLLDAFDEVSQDSVKDTMSYIEYIVTRFPNMQVVITSRPNSDIQNSTLFSVYDLAPIDRNDFEPILEKFYENDRPEIHRIISYLDSEANRIVDLITTPLLLTLLCITYNSTNKIPPSPYEFYQKLFFLLAERHDSTKPGFRREYSSKLTINKLERLFEGFSFFCMKSGSKTLNYQEAVKKVGDAAQLCDISPYSEKSFLDDCVKNTCLLLKEGFDYQFIHKSVMEYHAASFISSAGPELKKRFYSAAIHKSDVYDQELHYLSYIDQDSYERHFKLPVGKHVLELANYDGTSCTLDFYHEEIEVWFTVSKNKNSLRRLRNILVPDIPRVFDKLLFSSIRAVEKYINQVVIFEGDTPIFPMDDNAAFYSDLQVRNISKRDKKYFGAVLSTQKEGKFNLLLRELILEECKAIDDELKLLSNKLKRRDESIDSLEF